MSYEFKRMAFQIAAICVVIGVLRVAIDDVIARNWLRGLSLFFGLLIGQFVARPFFERQWPRPMKGWAE